MSGKVYQSKIAKYAGHTAGPWHWVNPATDESRCDGEIRSSLRTVKEHPAKFAFGRMLPEFVLDAEISDGDPMEANAALIADAPFLACEVERLREMLKAAVSVLDFFVNGNDLAQAMHDARNVIAKHKAKGGDQ